MAPQERRLIGLYSPAPQSGKSTVAGILSASHGFETRHFAGPLKRMVVDLLVSAGLTPERIGHLMEAGKEEPIPEVGGASFRYLCQTLGTEWGRQLIDNGLWINLLTRNPNLPRRVVVDDVRFPDEFEAIREAGGEVWKIVRPSATPTSGHLSEGLLEGREFDAEIVNDLSLDTLRTEVALILNG